MAAELAAQEWGDDADGGGGGGDGSSDGEAALEEAHHQQQLEELYFEQLRARYGYSTQARPGCCRLCGQEGHWVRDCPRNPDKQEAARRVVNPQPQLIAAAQQRAAFTPLPAPSNGGSASGSLVQLLAACLERQHLPASVCYQAGLCGAVQHFGATLFSSGWGCGYNNMQALASHLLAARPVRGQAGVQRRRWHRQRRMQAGAGQMHASVNVAAQLVCCAVLCCSCRRRGGCCLAAPATFQTFQRCRPG